MTVRFSCSCGAAYDLRDEYAGQTMACPVCGRQSVVGEAHTPPAAAELPTISDDMLSAGPATIHADMFAEPEPPVHAAPSDGRRDFEKGMPLAPALTLGLIAVNAVIFGWQMFGGALDSKEAIILAGALTRDHVLGAGGVAAPQPWRLFTAMFLHGSPDHLIGNCIVLYILGMACEHAYGLGRTAFLYLAAGLGGSLMSIAFSPGPSVGASGAIFGLMGAAIVFFVRHRDRFILRDSRVGVVLAVWAGWQIITGLAQPFIDNGAHIGGLIGGAALALVVEPAILNRLPPSERKA